MIDFEVMHSKAHQILRNGVLPKMYNLEYVAFHMTQYACRCKRFLRVPSVLALTAETCTRGNRNYQFRHLVIPIIPT